VGETELAEPQAVIQARVAGPAAKVGLGIAPLSSLVAQT
jgi:hypothetical protein